MYANRLNYTRSSVSDLKITIYEVMVMFSTSCGWPTVVAWAHNHFDRLPIEPNTDFVTVEWKERRKKKYRNFVIITCINTQIAAILLLLSLLLLQLSLLRSREYSTGTGTPALSAKRSSARTGREKCFSHFKLLRAFVQYYYIAMKPTTFDIANDKIIRISRTRCYAVCPERRGHRAQ